MGKKQQNKKAKKDATNRLAGVRKPTTKVVSTNLKKLKFQNQAKCEAVDSCLQDVVQSALKEKEMKKITEAQAAKSKPVPQKLPSADVDMAVGELDLLSV